MTTSPAGWYRDPTGKYNARYWDGQQWTANVNSGSANLTDEPPEDMRFVTPAPGTQATAAAPPPSVQVTQQASRSSVGTAMAVLVAIIAIALLVFVLNQSGDGDGAGTTPASDPPATTQAPADG